MAGRKVAPSEEPNWLDTDEMATWRALHLALAALPTALGNQLQQDSNLSFIEYYVLAVLSDQPEDTIRMSRLAILANSELSRLSHMVRRLEQRGLVRRELDPTDGRYTLAVLTPKGRDVLREAAPGHVAYVRSLIFDPLTQREQQAMRKALQKITEPFCDDDIRP
jgi:DNA-binding MarR family transcriptional regulator